MSSDDKKQNPDADKELTQASSDDDSLYSSDDQLLGDENTSGNNSPGAAADLAGSIKREPENITDDQNEDISLDDLDDDDFSDDDIDSELDDDWQDIVLETENVAAAARESQASSVKSQTGNNNALVALLVLGLVAGGAGYVLFSGSDNGGDARGYVQASSAISQPNAQQPLLPVPSAENVSEDVADNESAIDDIDIDLAALGATPTVVNVDTPEENFSSVDVVLPQPEAEENDVKSIGESEDSELDISEQFLPDIIDESIEQGSAEPSFADSDDEYAQTNKNENIEIAQLGQEGAHTPMLLSDKPAQNAPELVISSPPQAIKSVEELPDVDDLSVADLPEDPYLAEDDIVRLPEELTSESQENLPPISKKSLADYADGNTVYFEANDKDQTLFPPRAADSDGIRKVDPRTEPASRYVVVRTNYEAQDDEAKLASANRALELGRYEAALTIYNDLYKKHNRDARILMGRAVSLQKTGRVDAAFKAYQELIDIDDDNAEALLNMMGLLKEQYPEVTEKRLRELRSKYPDHPGVLAQSGVLYAQLGRYEQGYKMLMLAASMEPGNPQHLYNLAIMSDRNKRYKEAIKFYEQALDLDSVAGKGHDRLNRDAIQKRLASLRRR